MVKCDSGHPDRPFLERETRGSFACGCFAMREPTRDRRTRALMTLAYTPFRGLTSAAVSLLVFTAMVLCPTSRLRSQTGGSIDLVGFLDIPDSEYNTDVWGWVDPVTHEEYALVGNNLTGLHVVDVTNPSSPWIVSTLDTVPRFDIKTWGSFVYVVDGNYGFTGENGRIIDISDPFHPLPVGSFPPGHNIFIDDEGYMYLAFPGLKIFDLNPDPTNPRWVWEKVSTQGHDATVIGDRLYDFHGYDGTFIYDVTSRASPVLLGAITDSGIHFHHSGWTSADENFLFINDELALDPDPDIVVFDISIPGNPRKVSEISDPDATAHNSYRIGDYLYVAYYTAGFRVYDISDPRFPVLADEYDTTPLVGEGLFKGAWGCYPFSPSGYIFVNDRPDGFFIFSFEAFPTGVAAPAPLVLHPVRPNPFNMSTTISYELPAGGHLTATIFDVAGRRVRTLVDADQIEGPHEVVWNGTRDDGARAVSGVYFCRLNSGEVHVTQKIVLAN